MNIDLNELVQEIQNQFPKEFTICVQAVQIRTLQEQLPKEESAEE